MTQTIAQVFDAPVNNKYKLRLTSAKVRIEKLNKLKSTIKEFEEEVYAALNTDLRKSKFEAGMTELFFTLSKESTLTLFELVRPRSFSIYIKSVPGNTEKVILNCKGNLSVRNYNFFELFRIERSGIGYGNRKGSHDSHVTKTGSAIVLS